MLIDLLESSKAIGLCPMGNLHEPAAALSQIAELGQKLNNN